MNGLNDSQGDIWKSKTNSGLDLADDTFPSHSNALKVRLSLYRYDAVVGATSSLVLEKVRAEARQLLDKIIKLREEDCKYETTDTTCFVEHPSSLSFFLLKNFPIVFIAQDFGVTIVKLVSANVSSLHLFLW